MSAMTRKRKQLAKPEAEQYPRKNVFVAIEESDSELEQTRKSTAAVTSAEMAALRVMRGAERNSGYWDSIDVPFLMEQLRDQAAAVNRGDLAQAEVMLMNQATALQSLFARLAERGMGCDAAPGFEANFRMALRAQSQCRATLETLAAIKNPPVVYAKQANFANGHQQVNNGLAAPAQAGEKEIEPSKLLEAQHGNYVDTGTAEASSGADSQLATVGEIDRAEVGGR